MMEVDPTSWYYEACDNERCTKGVPKYFKTGDACLKCSHPIQETVLRYRMKMQVVDEYENTAILLMFDKIVVALIGMSAEKVMNNLIQMDMKDQLPEVFDKLVGREMLFLVDVDQKTISEVEDMKSFAIREFNEDPTVIAQFKNMFRSEEVASALYVECINVSPPPVKNKESCIESIDDSSGDGSITQDKVQVAMTSNDVAVDCVDFELSVTKLKKPKIEK